MAEVFEERRRAPRHRVTPPRAGGPLPHVALPLTMPIEVLDISKGGVLVQSVSPLEPALRCRLKLLLGHERVVADVTVSRCTPAKSAGEGFRIAAAFTMITDDNRRVLHRFLEQRSV